MELPKAYSEPKVRYTKTSVCYNPKEVEDKIYKLWEKSGFFNPDKLPGNRKKSFTIVLPPPNVTGELHMGHALNATVQDILIRWKRMQGFKTLWLPGTDHAGIATQNVVEKKLKKEGKTRFDLGKENFIKEVWAWKEKYGSIILGQFKKLGSSCDWSRTRFTMDEDYSRTVKEAFLHYYKKGLIYKGKRVINWCPRCQTSLSDLELEYEEEKSNLWYIKYPLAENKNDSITVATTRPETMLGDMAVAVNPKDDRYRNLVGKKLILPLIEKEIPVVTDRLIDKEFGTGALKVTPAHDFYDYEIGQKNKLEVLQVIDEKGKMINVPEKYIGLKTLEARKKVAEDLKNQGYLVKIEEYVHQVPKCYRCNSLIELIPSLQWFLKMGELAKLAAKPVKSEEIKFHPKSFEKPYLDWLKNIRDWCISRQIWWGHKIPLEGENDVLDTWFSSALWPFATLGWPSSSKATEGQTKKNDLRTFYPTNVLSTARDIINLWVTRMIFSGLEFMGKIPFKDVYIHATVLTKEGKRMSKSLGTGIDPINLIEKYGADATRFGIAYQIMGGQDIHFVEDNIAMGKKFCNKIWNASRFVLQQTANSKPLDARRRTPWRIAIQNAKPKLKTKNLTAADKKILAALEKTINSVNKDLENFRFGKAAHTLYDFFWHDFCDQYIEKSKEQHDKKTKDILFYVLINSLKLLHPFVPFITEEIYQTVRSALCNSKGIKQKLPFKKRRSCLMVEKWPN